MGKLLPAARARSFREILGNSSDVSCSISYAGKVIVPDRSGLTSVTATIGGTSAEVVFTGAQGDLIGVDQINLQLARALTGRGEVDLNLSVGGGAANSVKLNFASNK